MKPLTKIKLCAQEHWVISSLLIVIVVYALGRVAVHFISTSENYNMEKFDTLVHVMWIVDAIVIGLLGRLIVKKPKKTDPRPPHT